jgi:hypothetical protein
VSNFKYFFKILINDMESLVRALARDSFIKIYTRPNEMKAKDVRAKNMDLQPYWIVK